VPELQEVQVFGVPEQVLQIVLQLTQTISEVVVSSTSPVGQAGLQVLEYK